MEAVDFIELEGLLPGFDFVVNTVPDLVLPEALLKRLRREAVLLELASAPGGFDAEAAEKLGLKLIAAPGLPGQCAPYAAAELIRDAIYGVIREREE
jgi:dipicolinate synthase subunit A